jgi:hypothetical protein
VRELVRTTEVVHLVDAALAGREGERLDPGQPLDLVLVRVEEDVDPPPEVHPQRLLELDEGRDVGTHVLGQLRRVDRARGVVEDHVALLDGLGQDLEHLPVQVGQAVLREQGERQEQDGVLRRDE